MPIDKRIGIGYYPKIITSILTSPPACALTFLTMPTIKKRNSLPYNPALDGLRGVAIMMVMIFHATPQMLIGGFIGVDIFFVLSGFLITTLLIREQDFNQRVNLGRFYFRRLLRLAPALLFLLAVFSCASLYFLVGQERQKFFIDAGITFLYFSNWARAFGLHPPDYLGHTWSLAIEEQFYLLWPFLLILIMKCSGRRTIWLFLTASLVGCALAWRIYLSINDATAMRLYNGLDTRADALMVGCALAILLSLDNVRAYIAKGRSRILSLLALFSGIGLCLFAVYSQWNEPKMFYWGYTLVATLSAILIADLTQEQPSMTHKILSTPALVWLGTISYGLYLWHFPVYRVLLANGWTQNNVLWVGSLITLVIATCSYYLLERYFLKLKHRRFGSSS